MTVEDRFNPTNYAEAKEWFLEARMQEHGKYVTCPKFEYGKLDRDEILEHLERCRKLSQEIVQESYGADERKLLKSMLLSVYHKWRMLEAAYDLNHFEEENTGICTKEQVEARFRRYNAKVYGEPDKQTFISLLNYQLACLPGTYDFDSKDWQVRLVLESLVGDLETSELEFCVNSDELLPFVPLPMTVKLFAEVVKKRQRKLLKYLPEQKAVYSPDEVAMLLARILDAEYPESKFEVKVEPERTIFAVNQVEKVIKVPGERAKGPFDHEALISLVLGHEWTHVVRSLPYEDALISQLGTGLPGYDAFEEGVAICVEKALSGKTRAKVLGRIDHYVNIGLAMFAGRNFREVFEIRWRMLFLTDTKPNDSFSERVKAAQNLAFSQTVRAFRGTGYLPNSKDLMYYNGSVQVWRYIQSMGGNTEGLIRDLFESGKTDITNEMNLLALELEQKWQKKLREELAEDEEDEEDEE